MRQGPRAQPIRELAARRLEDFDAVLRKELSRRPPSWPVYVQGDPNLEWAWVLKVVDMVRGLPAEVVLVTRSP